MNLPRIQLALCGVLLGLASLGAWRLENVIAASDPGNGSAAALPPIFSVADDAKAASPSPTDTAEYQSRPLFERSRRPPVPPTAEPPKVAPHAEVAVMPPPPAQPPPPVIGIVVTDEQRFVLVRPPGETTPRVLHAGDELLGWRVASIAPTSVRLQAGAESRDVPLFPVAGQPGNDPKSQPLVPPPLFPPRAANGMATLLSMPQGKPVVAGP
jgi:hypothetical protein